MKKIAIFQSLKFTGYISRTNSVRKIKHKLFLRFLQLLRVNPVKAHLAVYSMLVPPDDDKGKPNERLMRLSIEAAKLAQNISVKNIANRQNSFTSKHPESYLELFPGEHYKLLGAMIQIMKPKLVIEIGTEKGLSCLCIKEYLPSESKIVTFDIIPWTNYPNGSYFQKEDFDNGQLIQNIGDLSKKEEFNKYAELFKRADFIFIDAAKDGKQEQLFIDNFKTIKFNNPPIIMFDDIRVWNMLKIWRDIDFPKLDITSFGHWTGTGIVDWNDLHNS